MSHKRRGYRSERQRTTYVLLEIARIELTTWRFLESCAAKFLTTLLVCHLHCRAQEVTEDKNLITEQKTTHRRFLLFFFKANRPAVSFP